MKNHRLTQLIPSFIVAVACVQGTMAAPESPKHPEGNPSPALPPLAAATPARGQSFVYLEFGDQENFPVAPSHITVPAGESVTMRGTPGLATSSVQWLKNGQPIPGATGRYLTIAEATRADAGVYSATFTGTDEKIYPSQSLVLGVAPAERLVNLSLFSSLPAGLGEGFIAGFVVSGGTGAKKMIVRAVGPSLAQFGFGHTLRQPVLRIRDASGKLYENSYTYIAVQGGLTYETDLAESLAKVGAFPTLPGAVDAVRLLPIVPGNYTVEVTSADNTGGAVLLEIYEVP